MIQLKHLCKKFGQQLAVDDLTLAGAGGRNLRLAGPQRRGQEHRHRHDARPGLALGRGGAVCGHDVTAHRRLALQKVGAIFESPAFYDYLSGRRNLEILSSYTARTSPQRIQEVIEWVGLSGRENSKVGPIPTV